MRTALVIVCLSIVCHTVFAQKTSRTIKKTPAVAASVKSPATNAVTNRTPVVPKEEPIIVIPVTPQRDPVIPYERPGPAPAANRIDEYVFSQLAKQSIRPSYLCSDEVFIRRVYFDITGTIPSSADVRAFLSNMNSNSVAAAGTNTATNKGTNAAMAAGTNNTNAVPDIRTVMARRLELIDRLLDSDEYVDLQAMKWGDILRIKSEFPVNLWPNAVQAYHRWIYSSIKSNMPYDRFARTLLTASGPNFRNPPVNFYRALQKKEPYSIAQAAALTFMGTRFDAWPTDKREGFAAFFGKVAYKATGEWKEEIVYFDPDRVPPKGTNGQPIVPVFPDGKKPVIDPSVDPRIVFADWLITPQNPYFTKAIVNRVWFWLIGRGIIHVPDDIRPDNPPQNPLLLAYLEREMISNNYDIKKLWRLILSSSTYQLSSIPSDPSRTNDISFSRYFTRRLEAEVVIDAICRITGTTESYSSPIPEPFTYIPENKRSVEIADGSITSTFLEMFGRPARDTGYELERNNTLTAAQKLHLLNSSQIQDKVRNSGVLRRALAIARTADRQVEELYLTIFSRKPTADELKIALDYIRVKNRNQNDAMIDLAWMLINSDEFIMKH